MTSNYAKYVKERLGRSIIESESGFITYSFHDDGQTCYICDIYIVPEARKRGLATEYANMVKNVAKERGARWLLGSVQPDAYGSTNSRLVLESYGMGYSHTGKDGLEYFLKEIR